MIGDKTELLLTQNTNLKSANQYPPNQAHTTSSNMRYMEKCEEEGIINRQSKNASPLRTNQAMSQSTKKIKNHIFSDGSEIDQSQLCSTNWEENSTMKRKTSTISESLRFGGNQSMHTGSNNDKAFQYNNEFNQPNKFTMAKQGGKTNMTPAHNQEINPNIQTEPYSRIGSTLNTEQLMSSSVMDRQQNDTNHATLSKQCSQEKIILVSGNKNKQNIFYKPQMHLENANISSSVSDNIRGHQKTYQSTNNIEISSKNQEQQLPTSSKNQLSNQEMKQQIKTQEEKAKSQTKNLRHSSSRNALSKTINQGTLGVANAHQILANRPENYQSESNNEQSSSVRESRSTISESRLISAQVQTPLKQSTSRQKLLQTISHGKPIGPKSGGRGILTEKILPADKFSNLIKLQMKTVNDDGLSNLEDAGWPNNGMKSKQHSRSQLRTNNQQRPRPCSDSSSFSDSEDEIARSHQNSSAKKGGKNIANKTTSRIRAAQDAQKSLIRNSSRSFNTYNNIKHGDTKALHGQTHQQKLLSKIKKQRRSFDMNLEDTYTFTYSSTDEAISGSVFPKKNSPSKKQEKKKASDKKQLLHNKCYNSSLSSSSQISNSDSDQRQSKYLSSRKHKRNFQKKKLRQTSGQYQQNNGQMPDFGMFNSGQQQMMAPPGFPAFNYMGINMGGPNMMVPINTQIMNFYPNNQVMPMGQNSMYQTQEQQQQLMNQQLYLQMSASQFLPPQHMMGMNLAQSQGFNNTNTAKANNNYVINSPPIYESPKKSQTGEFGNPNYQVMSPPKTQKAETSLKRFSTNVGNQNQNLQSTPIENKIQFTTQNIASNQNQQQQKVLQQNANQKYLDSLRNKYSALEDNSQANFDGTKSQYERSQIEEPMPSQKQQSRTALLSPSSTSRDSIQLNQPRLFNNQQPTPNKVQTDTQMHSQTGRQHFDNTSQQNSPMINQKQLYQSSGFSEGLRVGGGGGGALNQYSGSQTTRHEQSHHIKGGFQQKAFQGANSTTHTNQLNNNLRQSMGVAETERQSNVSKYVSQSPASRPSRVGQLNKDMQQNSQSIIHLQQVQQSFGNQEGYPQTLIDEQNDYRYLSPQPVKKQQNTTMNMNIQSKLQALNQKLNMQQTTKTEEDAQTPSTGRRDGHQQLIEQNKSNSSENSEQKIINYLKESIKEEGIQSFNVSFKEMSQQIQTSKFKDELGQITPKEYQRQSVQAKPQKAELLLISIDAPGTTKGGALNSAKPPRFSQNNKQTNKLTKDQSSSNKHKKEQSNNNGKQDKESSLKRHIQQMKQNRLDEESPSGKQGSTNNSPQKKEFESMGASGSSTTILTDMFKATMKGFTSLFKYSQDKNNSINNSDLVRGSPKDQTQKQMARGVSTNIVESSSHTLLTQKGGARGENTNRSGGAHYGAKSSSQSKMQAADSPSSQNQISLVKQNNGAKASRTKEQILEQRKQMMKSKVVAKKDNFTAALDEPKASVHSQKLGNNTATQSLSPKKTSSAHVKEPNLEIMHRLALGQKIQMDAKEMKKLTNKNYENLPEIKLKKEEKLKKEQLKQRQQIAKQYAKEIDQKRKTMHEKKTVSSLQNEF